MVQPLPLFDQLLKHSTGLLAADSWPSLAREIAIRYPQVSPGTEQLQVNPNEVIDNRDPFGYKHNSLGFRDHEPLDHVDTCYYGCSQTYALGVNQSSRFGEQLDQLLAGTSNNFGILGISGEELVYLFMATSRLVKMRQAVFLFPDVPRQVLPFVSGSQARYNTLMYNRNFEKDPDCAPYLDEMNAAYNAFHRLPAEFFYDRLRNQVQTLDYLGQLMNIKIVITSWSTYTYSALIPINASTGSRWLLPSHVDPAQDLARDSMHSGPQTHLKWAQAIYEVLQQTK
jgi:hypothetical protein